MALTDHAARPEGTAPPHLRPSSLALVAAAALGLAAWAPDSGGPGLFLPLVAVLAGAAVVRSGGFRPTPAGIASGLAALALVGTAAVRDAAWILVPNLLFSLVFAALAVAQPRTWTEALAGVLAPASRLPATPAALVRSASAAAGARDPARVAALVRGVVAGGVLLAVFWGLFASADRVFARLTGDLLPDWDLGLLPARIVVFAAAALVTGAFVLAATRGAPGWLGALVGRLDTPVLRPGRIEWLVVLGLLNGLFGAFCAVQLAVAAQGHDHILRTAGLTYAAYAREGFAQLLAAAALTVVVVCVAWTRARRQRRGDQVLLKALLGLLCVLTLAIVGSALRRLGLYEEAFGFTRERLTAGLLVLTGINPDAAIARRNLDRHAETATIDLSYLRGLSADAVPVLAGHPDPVAGLVLADPGALLPAEEPWSSANLSRIRARQLLEERGLQPPRS